MKYFLRHWIRLHCRTERGNWTPPEAKIKMGEPPREKVADKAEYKLDLFVCLFVCWNEALSVR